MRFAAVVVVADRRAFHSRLVVVRAREKRPVVAFWEYGKGSALPTGHSEVRGPRKCKREGRDASSFEDAEVRISREGW